DATVDDYNQFKERLGHSRHVLVQPSSYETDNRCLTDALAAFGSNARGEAVVDDTVSDAGLDGLQLAGVTGVRFNLGAGNAT
ncbi:amidohydrolase, partial [Pantoea sp. GbtcB22]|uniref:amidohydrolase n=1 Tax=Pantoea sp. GbtcB22 TaxID=2824767 RepID=UPI0034D320C6